MRRFGIHGVVALAGLVACGRFGSGDDDVVEPVNRPDASSPTDSGGGGGPDAGVNDDGAAVGRDFCREHAGATLCADFENGPPANATAPLGAPPFSYAIGPAPGGRSALRLASTKVDKDKSFGLEQGAFHLDIPSGVATAQLDFDVMCQSARFDFVRLAGFAYEWKDGQRDSLAVDLFGNVRKFAADDEGKLLTAPMTLDDWAHVSMTVTRTGDDLAGVVRVDGAPIGPPAKMSVKEAGGHIVFGFGAYDISETNTDELVVWIDNLLLTLP